MTYTFEYRAKSRTFFLTLPDAEWMEDLAFAVDVTALMNEPHPKLQLSKVCLHMKCKAW